MKMDMGDVYRRLEFLNEKGFVEKSLGNPNEYKAIPLKDSVKLLIEAKNKEYTEMQKKVELLLKKRVNHAAIKENKYSFSIVPQNEARKQYIFRASDRVKKEWIVYTQIERYPVTVTGYFESHKKAFDRGVKYRVILELNKPTDVIVKFLQETQKQNPGLEIRYTYTNLLVSFGIYDKKEMNFSTEGLKGLADSQVLVTDNPQLVRVVYDYFDLRWKTAMREYPKKENSEIDKDSV